MMRAFRRLFRPRVILALVVWTSLVILFQTFKGAGVGNPLSCATDPNCGEIAWIPPVAWAAGAVVILAIGWVTRRE